MSFYEIVFGVKKKKTVKKEKPVRVSVHLHNGTTIVHYCNYRTINGSGVLSLHDAKDGSKVVADYAAGTWLGASVGKRCVSKGTNQ